MEQPETPDDVLRLVQLSPQQHPSLSTPTPSNNSHLAKSEPSPEPPLTADPSEDLTDSGLSLRFPRPAGNRQLTNWVSCSSPDIMQTGNIPDEDPSLTELGYDIIGTDGESQAESIASSFDYQKPDDIHSLAGTDVDTDSSEDEETTLNEPTISDTTVVDRTDHDDAAEVEVLDILNQSLESPTSLPITSFSPFASLTYLDQFRTHEPNAVISSQLSPVKGLSLLQQEILTGTEADREPDSLGPQTPKTSREYTSFRPALTYLRESWRTLAVLSGFIIIYFIGSVSRSVFSGVPIPKQLSTVPVASVPIAVTPSSITTGSSIKTPTSMISSTPSSLQTASSPNGLMFIPFGKEAAQVDAVSKRISEAICSAELAGRDEILIRIPQNIKSSWLAKDAILIAVSRGLEDIPTKVSSVDEGILIQVPLREAYGMMAVTIATTYKPRVNEKLHVDFGAYRFSEALDAGKHLVREFAQRVVDTVNGTTSWVEDTYIPTLDIVSKQVYGQTVSISDSVLHGLQDASGALLAIPSLLMAQLQPFLEVKLLLRRANQLRLEVAQEGRNVRDELHMAILTSRINSKLLWLRMQGKLEERQEYLARAEMYLKEQHARVESTRVERAERTKEQIRAWHERDRPVSPKGTLWNTLGAWVGLEG